MSTSNKLYLVMLYLLLTILMLSYDFLPKWQQWQALRAEIDLQNSQVTQLREQAALIHQPTTNMLAAPNQENESLVTIVQLLHQHQLHLHTADSLGALTTPYGMAENIRIHVTGDLIEIAQSLAALQQAIPAAIVSDFALREIDQQLQMKMQILLFKYTVDREPNAATPLSPYIPICGVSWIHLTDGRVLPIHVEQAAGTAKRFSADLRNTPIATVLHVLAKLFQQNIIVSPQLPGLVNLQLQEVDPKQVFHLLLNTYGLAKSSVGNIWYIAPRGELMKQQQDEVAWLALQEQRLPLQTEVWQIRYAKAGEIAHLLQDAQASLLSKRGHVRVEARTNSLCVQDIPEYIQKIHRVIQRVDVPVKQVLIKVRIVSIDKEYERELGVIFTVKAPVEQSSGVSVAKALTREMGNYSVAFSRLADSSLLDVKLSALEQAGHAELISNPSLFTANQQVASIEAGDEIPYQEVSESGGTAVAFKKAVLGLKVVPQVLPGDRVLLQLQINQDRPSNRLVQGVPTINTHQIHTSVLVANGKTVVLGGVYELNQETGENRIPYLADLPVVGNLFKQQLKKKNKRELLIFVTPKIMT